MIIIMQPELDAAVAFYKDFIGLKLKFHLKEKWAEFELGDLRIGLCPTGRPALEVVRTGIVMEVEDLYMAYNDLKDRVTFLGEPSEAVHGIMVSFQDPGGNIIDLYQPTPEKVRDLVLKTVKKDGESQEDCCNDDDSQQDECCGGGSCES